MSPQSIDQTLQQGLAHHQAGRLDEAEALYRRALASDSDHPLALNLLGVLTRATQGDAAAEPLLRRAAALQASEAQYACDLARLLHSQKRFDEAIAEYRRAVSLDPEWADAQFGLARVLAESLQWDEALAIAQRALELEPDNPASQELLWVIHHNLGVQSEQRGQLDEAIHHYQLAISIQPARPESHYTLGNVLRMLGRASEAVAAYQAAVALRPSFVHARANLGGLLDEMGQTNEAEQHLLIAIKDAPELATAHSNLGRLYHKLGLIQPALDCYRKAMTLDPALEPAASNFIYAMHCDPALTPAAILEQARAWGANAHIRAAPARRALDNKPDPDRVLRIGYVSPDFRQHSVAFFLEPLLANHDPDRFEIICYQQGLYQDDVTARLASWASDWRNITMLDDDQAAELIRRDRIDLLVDLAGHTASHRLGVFARKPAPIQITYLGYPGTTGLSAIDYRLTDAITDPPGADVFYTERLLRLDRCFLCYRPPADAPDPAPQPPIARSGQITFGSFNNMSKASDQILGLWSRLLAAMPQARLLLKSARITEPAAISRIHQRLAQFALPLDRVQVVAAAPDLPSHLKRYDDIDIALDTFPYHGTTTTCEALWMGVPVVTLAGPTHVSRVGVSLLTHAGCGDWVAADEGHYLTVARHLAGDPAQLQRLRAGLRDQLRRSPLMDEPSFARAVERVYRDVWVRWCDTRGLGG